MGTIRMQFDVTSEKAQEIDDLIEECGFASKKDFFNNAITLLKWTVKHARNGNAIASIDADEKRYRELQMPFLETVQSKSKSKSKNPAAA